MPGVNQAVCQGRFRFVLGRLIYFEIVLPPSFCRFQARAFDFNNRPMASNRVCESSVRFFRPPR